MLKIWFKASPKAIVRQNFIKKIFVKFVFIVRLRQLWQKFKAEFLNIIHIVDLPARVSMFYRNLSLYIFNV